jgi:hypothetical protein
VAGEAASKSGADLTVHGLIDRLVERYSSGPHKLTAMRAREEYFDRAGKVFDDDAELFEGRMASFLEWYVLERPFGSTLSDLAPVVRALGEPGWTDGERRGLAHLASSHRSLFELHSVADRVLEIEDLVGGARFSVTERRKTVGFSVGDVFEARVLWDGFLPIFGRTFLFHPPDAREAVLDAVERAVEGGVAREEILFQLSRHHIRWHRLGHLGAAKIYRDA